MYDKLTTEDFEKGLVLFTEQSDQVDIVIRIDIEPFQTNWKEMLSDDTLYISKYIYHLSKSQRMR